MSKKTDAAVRKAEQAYQDALTGSSSQADVEDAEAALTAAREKANGGSGPTTTGAT